MKKSQFLCISILSGILAFLLMFGVVAYVIINAVAGDMDENHRVKFVSREYNEGKDLWAIKYVTSGFNSEHTKNLEISKNVATPEEPGNILRTHNEFDYYWQDEDAMVVIIYGNRSIYHQETEYKGIKIIYEKGQNI